MADVRPVFVKHQPRRCPPLGELYSLPLAYGTAPAGLKWSPDGRTLAFLWNAEGGLRMDVHVARADGAGPERLTDAAAVAAPPREDDEREAEDVAYAERMYPGVTALDWSADSQALYYLCRGDLFRVAAAGGAPVRLTQSAAGRGNLQVSPDGRRVGFVQGGNLWAYDTTTGALVQVTYFSKADMAVERYAWSPDGRWAAVVVEDRSGLDMVKMPDYTPLKGVKIHELRRDNVGRPLARVRVGIVPAAGGKMERLPLVEPGQPRSAYDPKDTGNTLQVNQIGWTQDSARLIVTYRDRTYRQWSLAVARPEAVAETVELRREYAEPWFCWSPLGISPDSRYAYYLSYATGWQHIYRLPLDGGLPEAVTAGAFDVTHFVVPKAGDSVYYTAHAPHPQELRAYRVPLKGGEATEISPSELTWSSVEPSDDGRALAFVSSRVLTPPEVYCRVGDAPPRRATQSPRDVYARLPQPRSERFTFTNESDGATVHARLMLPPDFDPAQRYPVVFSCVYAGQGKDAFGRYQLLDAYMAAEMGYIVVGVDLRASQGYGRDFLYGYHRQLGLIDSDELVSCARHLQQRPYVDGERLGIWGGSYGGFLTLMVMSRHPGVFRAGISWKPVTDWRNYNDSYTVERLRRPDELPEVYRATSPVFHAEKLAGRLLLVHGMLDDNVLFQDCVWMVQRLIEAGKHFDLMVYPRDDHGFTLRHESLPDLMERMAAYFEEHLGLGPGR